MKSPQFVCIVGCAGLLSNIIGLVLFHDHSHGGHGHSHGHAHDEEDAAEQGHNHEHLDESESAEQGAAVRVHPRSVYHLHVILTSLYRAQSLNQPLPIPVVEPWAANTASHADTATLAVGSKISVDTQQP